MKPTRFDVTVPTKRTPNIHIQEHMQENEWQNMSKVQLQQYCLKMEKWSLPSEKVNLKSGTNWSAKMDMSFTKSSCNTAQYVLKVTL